MSAIYKKQDSDSKQLATLLGQIDKLGAKHGDFRVEVLPTGIATFDSSTGVGGVPRQRLSIFQGEEHTGKTLLLLTLIASTQRNGGRCAMVDAEHALTRSFAELLGVNWDELLVIRPQSMNQAYDVVRHLCTSGLFDVVGLDSAVALATEDEVNGSASDSTKRAGLAQLHSSELRKLVTYLHARTAFVMINQLRENPNPPVWAKGGKVLYAPGGKALKFYSSLTVEVGKGKVYNHGDVRVGQQIKTKCVKNKVGTPFQKAEFDLMYNTGLDLVTNLIETCIEKEIIKRKSSMFFFDVVDFDTGEVIREVKVSGRAALDQCIRDDDDLRIYLETVALEMAGGAEEEE